VTAGLRARGSYIPTDRVSWAPFRAAPRDTHWHLIGGQTCVCSVLCVSERKARAQGKSGLWILWVFVMNRPCACLGKSIWVIRRGRFEIFTRPTECCPNPLFYEHETKTTKLSFPHQPHLLSSPFYALPAITASNNIHNGMHSSSIASVITFGY
jgi:hypothetical protein